MLSNIFVMTNPIDFTPCADNCGSIPCSQCGIKSDKSYHVHEEEEIEGHKTTNPIDFTPCGENSGQIPCPLCRKC
jgi:hypothetical protein